MNKSVSFVFGVLIGIAGFGIYQHWRTSSIDHPTPTVAVSAGKIASAEELLTGLGKINSPNRRVQYIYNQLGLLSDSEMNLLAVEFLALPPITPFWSDSAPTIECYWAERQPEQALEWALNQPSLVRTFKLIHVIQDIEKIHPEVAANFIAAHPEVTMPTKETGEFSEYTTKIYQVWAAKDPAAAYRSCSALSSRLRQYVQQIVLTTWASNDPSTAMETVQKLTSGRDLAVETVFTTWCKKSPAAAYDWRDQQSAQDKIKLKPFSGLDILALKDPARTIQILRELSAQDASAAVRRISESAVFQDQKGAMVWALALPAEFRTTAIIGLAPRLTNEPAQSILDLANHITEDDSQEVANHRVYFFSKLFNTTSLESSQELAKLRELLSLLNAPEAAKVLVDAAPYLRLIEDEPALAAELLRKYVNDKTIDDFEHHWATLGRYYCAKNSDEAINWALSLPSELRNATLYGLLPDLAETDPKHAVELAIKYQVTEGSDSLLPSLFDDWAQSDLAAFEKAISGWPTKIRPMAIEALQRAKAH